MARKKERIPEVHFYEWSVSRWRASVTRAQLDPVGRYIYREFLDLCYTQGSIPRDPTVQAAMVDCSIDEINRVWPILKRHFIADKKDPELLTNKVADTYRRAYFSYLRTQKTNRRKRKTEKKPESSKKVAGKSNDLNEMDYGGSGARLPIREEKKREEKRREENTHLDRAFMEWLESVYPKPIGDSDGRALVSYLDSNDDVQTFRANLSAWIEYWKAAGYSHGLKSFLAEGLWRKQPPKIPDEKPGASVIDKRLAALRNAK